MPFGTPTGDPNDPTFYEQWQDQQGWLSGPTVESKIPGFGGNPTPASGGGAGGGGDGGGESGGASVNTDFQIPGFPGANYPGYTNWTAEGFQKAFQQQMTQGANILQQLVADPQLRMIHATMLAGSFAPPPNWQDFMSGKLVQDIQQQSQAAPPRPYPASIDAVLNAISPPRGYNKSVFPINAKGSNGFGAALAGG